MFFSTGAQLQAALSALPAGKVGSYTAFDAFYYGTTYMGAYSGSLSPIEHFVQIGAARGYKPNADFDPVFYANQYADLKGKGFDAADLLYHFMQYGLDEGRAPNASYVNFDADAYLAAYPDVKAYIEANLDQFGGSLSNGAIAHFVKFGQAEGRVVPGAAADTTFTLTAGQDTLLGTTADDSFKANVVQNASGAQVNSLGSGDELNGQGGTDTLNAKVTAGVFAGGSWSMPIQPETSSVEIVKIEAVLSDVPAIANGDVDQVFINAKDMEGVEQLWSNRSDADLTVMNLTTKGLTQLSDMTIGMAYTGNADSQWGESDLHVYFDQDYLTPEATRTNPVVDFLAMNEDNFDASNGLRPLEGVFFRELQFTLNGQVFDLVPYLNEDPAGKGDEIVTYADFLAAVQAALVELKADNAGNAALQTVTASFGQVFTTDVNPVTLELRSGTAVRLTVDGLTNGVANTLAVAATDLEVARAAGATVPNNNRYELADDTPPTAGEKLAINVALEKVGLAGDGGELVIGSMNKAAGNIWDAVNTVAEGTTSGIEEFNVTVYGDSSKSSSLAGLHSTNNNLRVVTVVTDAALTGASFADLTIGNSNTAGLEDLVNVANENALKDVQTFDASGFRGDLTLFAALTEEVTAKYLDVVDDAADPADDNVNFAYTSGTGDDFISLYLDPANLAQPGTATREDLTLTISTGAGDDEVAVSTLDSGDANWYANQKINANLAMAGGEATGQLQINAGDGNDTVRTLFAGDYAINAGTGDDTVYADNTGDRSTWIINAVNSDPADLESEPAVAAATGIANLFLNVSFKGYDAQVAVGGSNGSLLGVSVDDLTINQAIKDAINNDAVLSKLLIAEDGPGRTLVITSLIDGVQSGLDDINDIVFTLSSTALSAGQALNASLLSGAQAAALGFGTGVDALAYVAVGGDRFDANDIGVGTDSGAESDNLIVGGTGNDVLVLGTGADSNDTVGYAGFGNGTDSIVNFVDSGVVAIPAGLTNLAEVVSIVDGTGAAAAAAESFTLTLTGSVAAAAGSITLAAAYFDNGGADIVIAPAPGDTAAQVAAALVNANNLVATRDWQAVDNGDGTVTFTQVAGTESNVADVTIAQAGADISFDLSGVGITAAVTDGVSAGAGAAEVVTVAFGDATIDGTYTFAGISVAVLAGETGENIAASFAAAAGTFTDWTAAQVGATNLVTFTNDNLGDVANLTDASFVGANVVTPATTVVGFQANSDILDFTSYNAEAVYVDGVLVAGAAALAGEDYVTLVESATNAGEYTMSVFTEAGATDTLVGVIGIADFGDTQVFSADNFAV